MRKITICIPTLNSAHTLSACLDCLLTQPVTSFSWVIIYDSGSRDGTMEMVEGMIKNKWYPFKMALLKTDERAGERLKNIPYIRYKLLRAVETFYTMFLDCDVLLPPRAIQRMLKEFKDKKNKNLGMIGARYEPLANHVQMGAAVLKTEVAREIKWIIDERCECLHAAEQLAGMGLTVRYHPNIQARHLKFL